MRNFRNKTAFIIGGSSGIGLSAAKLLASKGSNIVIFARTKKRLEEAVEEISSTKKHAPQKVAYYQLDVADPKVVKRVMKKAVQEYGAPDLLINCAGRAYPYKFEDISFEQFDETMKINMYGIWNVCSELVPHMKEKGGTIVNTSSMCGFLGVFGYTDYSASKFAVVGFSEALRSEMKQHNIDVLVLCPPDTDTPGYQVENTTKPEETKKISAGARIMTSDDVALSMMNGIKKGKFMIVPGFDGKLSFIVKRLFPWLVEMVMDSDIKKVQKGE